MLSLADKTKCIMLIVRWCVDLARVIVRVLLEFQKKEGKKGKRKGENQYQNFPIFTRTYVIGAQKNRLDETALLGTCNEC